ncbi:MAG: hypothetical protein N2512_12250 [Armatimonadetes bacterium]|nr:hypothetical protein [Armatimonadota bacterium]
MPELGERLRWFIEDVAQNIVGLDLALFFQAHPGIFDTVFGIANRVARPPEEIQAALDRLAAAGILEQHELGAGRYRCYSLRRTEEVWRLLCRLSELYLDDPAARREIIKSLVRRHGRKTDAPAQEEAPGGENE